MTSKPTIWLREAENTNSCGFSLAQSIYRPVTIYLDGELGAGKTTFLNGFSTALGISDYLTSPTYALEQRYETDSLELLHLDLYRLSTEDARKLVASTDDHEAIRCIEWAERLDSPLDDGIKIFITDPKEKEGRELSISFDDMPLPSYQDILKWRKEMMLPAHICDHCDAVAMVARDLALHMIGSGTIVRSEAVERAGQIHDLFRFVDFTLGASHSDIEHTNEQHTVWKDIKDKFKGMRHEQACAEFLRERGFPDLATIVQAHGPGSKMIGSRDTTEQKLLFYADKRAIVDKIVTVEERFEDFQNRYTEGKETLEGKQWKEETKAVEAELFPDGVPF
ncbi:MAG: tRNA (adenosine(37)-N6)-threonylcarbamoyltransferase complex ATPase subunit type 1 TsaE [bacterium]|nr:tRNA (adenosine(37)-N6)-threonylcarbamoyltransferase complex ATPase subunit type 1 TsaE [bacterium]